MISQKYEKYEFFEEFLMEVFDINDLDQINNRDGSVTKVNTNFAILSQELEKSWEYLLNESYDFSIIQQEFLNYFIPWKEKFTAFQSVKNEDDFITFLKGYFSVWMKLSFENKDISKKEIKEIIQYERPNFLSLFENPLGPYANLLIFQSDSFKITIHLKMRKYATDTYGLLIITSFWFLDSREYWEADLDNINKNYMNSMIAFNIINKLKSLNYENNTLIPPKAKDDLLNIPGSQLIGGFTDLFHPSNNMILEIISVNPINLFLEIKSHLYQIEEIIQEQSKNTDYSPQKHFENLTSELKQFLKKGKELFLKAEDFLKEPDVDKSVRKKDIKTDLEDEKLSFDQIIALFKDTLEKDKKDDTIKPENMGFRTINQMYSLYKDQLEVSKPTYYSYFEKLRIETFLEERSKVGKGGGKEYRYKELKDSVQQIPLKPDETEDKKIELSLLAEKIRIQEALGFYNSRNFEKSIEILNDLLSKSSSELAKDVDLYCSCLYYLGRSYFKINKFEKAAENFNKAYIKNKTLYNVNYSLAESYFKLRKYTKALKHTDECIYGIKAVFEENLENVNLNYIFINELELDDLEEITTDLMNLDIFSKSIVSINKPEDQIKIYSYYFSKIKLDDKARKNVKRNIISMQILYKKFISAMYLKLELLRSIIFNLVLKNTHERIEPFINEFVTHSKKLNKEYILEDNLPINDFVNYLTYFKSISKAFDIPIINEKVSRAFPNIEGYLSIPRIHYLRENFSEEYSFVNIVNRLFKEDFKETTRILKDLSINDSYSTSPNINRPECKAEYYFSQAYLNWKYSIDQRIEFEQDKNQTFDPSSIDSIDKILNTRDKYHSTSFNQNHPIYYIQMAEKAFAYSNKYNFKDLIRWTKKILRETKEKYSIIKNLRLSVRKKIVNRKLEILSKTYDYKEMEINLEFEKEPKEEFRHFVNIRVKREFWNYFEENTGELVYKIKLFDSELNEDVFNELKNEIFYRTDVKGRKIGLFDLDLKIEENLEDTDLKLKLIHIKDFREHGDRFGNQLDDINRHLYSAIFLNLNSFLIKFRSEDIEKYKFYFEHKFQNEYENEFFDFIISEDWSDNQVKIQIIKK